MEGKGVLFKRFADIDVFDIEIAETDPDKFIDIAGFEPTLVVSTSRTSKRLSVSISKRRSASG